MKFGLHVKGLNGVTKELKTDFTRLRNLVPLWRNIGQYMTTSTIRRFNEGKAPDGTEWKPVSRPSATKERRNAQGRNKKYKSKPKPLNDTGRLKSSIHYLVGPSSVVVGTKLKYAAIHQFGGDINVTPKMRAYLHSQGIHLRKTTQKIHIPARPFIGVSDKDMAAIKMMMQRHLKGR